MPNSTAAEPPIVVSSDTPPSCRLLVRSKLGVQLFAVPERPSDPVPRQRSNPFLLQGVSTTLMRTAPDGSCAYVHVTGIGIVRCDLSDSSGGGGGGGVDALTRDNMTPFLKDTKNIQMMDVSPSGTFLLTWERLNPETCPNNLKVWEASSGTLLAAFPQKNLTRDAWPYLQWTADEQYAFLLAGTEVRIFPKANVCVNDKNGDEESSAAPRYTEKLRIPGIRSLSLPQTPVEDTNNNSNNSPMVAYYFTSFCPGTKDKPAKAGLHAYQPGISNTKSNPYPSLLSKSLFQAEEMKSHWSPLNDSALITLQTSVDASGQSYYGSSQLFLLSAASKEVIAVPLPEEGPVADVKWMPNPTKPPCFTVVAGRMPSMASLHHGVTGKASFLFGHAHRNTIAWAPHGRFLCLAGFGNLAGGMGFWDKNKLKLIPGCTTNNNDSLNVTGQLRAEAVVGYGWSPDSRVFCVSTCTPRMNVDNGIRLFTYAGQECLNVPWNNEQDYRPDKLLEATFVPAKLSTYPDRPQTPPLAVGGAAESATTPTTATAASATRTQKTPAAAPAPSKPAGRYVPPSARGKQGSGTSLAERMRREKEGKLVGATKVTSKVGAAVVRPKPTIVGLAAPVEPSKSKSALRREKAKQKKVQEQQQLSNISDAQSAQQQEQGEEKAKEETTSQQMDPEKRARKIKKTLKQIEDLKAKDLASLNDDQKKKLASEEELLQELKDLGM